MHNMLRLRLIVFSRALREFQRFNLDRSLEFFFSEMLIGSHCAGIYCFKGWVTAGALAAHGNRAGKSSR